MKKGWHKAYIPFPNRSNGEPVPIVWDGAISTRVLGEGKLIPVLILNTSNRPDIEDMIKAQNSLPPGDVEIRWGRLHHSKSKIALILKFIRPSNVLIILEFNAADQGILIEQILRTKALYLQPGRKGDRLDPTIETPRILIEIPDLGFGKEWERVWPKEVAKKLKKRGLKRQDAKRAAKEVISQIQEFSEFRLR